MNQYWIGRDGKQFGPYPADAIRLGFSSGKILPSDLLWAEGMSEWVPAAVVLGATPGIATAPAPEAPAASSVPAPSAVTPANPYRAPVAPVDHPVVEGDITYAGFWARLAASFIDGLVILIPLCVLAAVPVVGWLGAIVLAWLYFAVMESGERGATLGKRAMKLQVLSADGVERIGFGRATGRFFGRYLSTFLLYIGYLIQPFTARKQALHDMITSTVVVSRGSAPGGVIALVIGLFIAVPFVGGILAADAIPAYQDYQKRAQARGAVASDAASPQPAAGGPKTVAPSLALTAEERAEVQSMKGAGQTQGFLGHEIAHNVRLHVLTDNFGENPTCIVAVRAHDKKTGQLIHPSWDLNVQIGRESKLVHTKNHISNSADEIRLILIDSGRRYSLRDRMQKPGFLGTDLTPQLANDLLVTKQAKAVSGMIADTEFASHYDLSGFAKGYKYARALCPY